MIYTSFLNATYVFIHNLKLEESMLIQSCANVKFNNSGCIHDGDSPWHLKTSFVEQHTVPCSPCGYYNHISQSLAWSDFLHVVGNGLQLLVSDSANSFIILALQLSKYCFWQVILNSMLQSHTFKVTNVTNCHGGPCQYHLSPLGGWPPPTLRRTLLLGEVCSYRDV